MEITIQIETCWDCNHKDHTGAFTPGGSKPCCHHPHTIKMNDGRRVIPYNKVKEDNRSIFNKDSFIQPARYNNELKGIPTWCPLKQGKAY